MGSVTQTPFPSYNATLSTTTPLPDVNQPKDLWWVGAIINVVGSLLINMGTNVIKLGHNKRALVDLPECEKPKIWKFKEWCIGMGLFSVGNVLNFVSFGFAAQSLLAALGSVQFIANIFFAYFVLHEAVTKLIILATACIIGGCILLVVFGNQSSATYTVQELIGLYSAPAYVVYLTMMGVFVFGSYIVYLHGKNVVSKKGHARFWSYILPVAYAIFSALLGTQSVLFSKSLSVLLRLTFTGDSQLGFWYTWVVLPIFVITAVFWVTRLNKGLRMFPAMLIVPIMQIAWTLLSIISGMLYFKEYTSFTPLKAGMFGLGVVIVLTGVMILTLGQKPKDSEDGTDDDKTAVHDNAVFTRTYDERDPDKPKKTLDFDTLRFTSLAANTGANIKDLIHMESVKRKAKEGRDAEAKAEGETAASDFNTTALTVASSTQPPHAFNSSMNPAFDSTNPGLNSTNRSMLSGTERSTMMDTVKRGLKTWQARLTEDFGLQDGKESMKQALGFGSSPPISLFGMPTADLNNSRGARGSHTAHRYEPMVLPGSRFYGEAADGTNKDGRALPRRGSYDIELGTRGMIEHSGPSQTDILDRSRSADGTSRHASHSDTSRFGPGDVVTAEFESGAANALAGSRLLGTSGGGGTRADVNGMLTSAVDGVERAARRSVEKLKQAPSDVRRVIRKQQGYGPLGEDNNDSDEQFGDPSLHRVTEKTGLLGSRVQSDAQP